ncbi:extracellular solute-binding protein [Paenibacillus ginsengarvi]|uniref:Extracellular solute-binding protein n=1 Tax=Paenibacillus ginsengarvi TaxID=400777 RepID=A0A3B0CP03_9BACL|nr:extracellular solute-binding protein [Paenibacillus ginsengarvi]RKN85556.1 extracellular solute-binding protein [Paenibacillus ginsengarvi]
MEEKSGRKYFRERMDSMVRTIREEIRTGKLKDGDFLPSEKTYAKSYDLSNKSVRQGLDILVAERLVEKIPRVGNKVVRPSSEARTTVRLGYYTSLLEQAALEPLLEQFQERHPDIRVELVPLPSSHTAQALRPLLCDGHIDLLTLSAPGFADLAENGGTEELETLTPDPQVYKFLTETMSDNGELKAQPFVFSPLILCYNRAHLRKMDVPEPDSGWSWDDLFEYSSRLNVDNERIGFYFHFPSYNRWPVFLLQSGMTFRRDEEGRIGLEGDGLRNVLRICQRLIARQSGFPLLLSEREADAEKLFFAGKVSMIMTTYYSLNAYRQQTNVKYDIAPLPFGSENRTLLLAIGLAVNRMSERKDSAKLLLDFLMSYRSQLAIRQATLSIPSLKPAAEWTGYEKMYRPSRFHLYREIIPTFAPHSRLKLSIEELQLFQREARLYWSGLETEEALLERLGSMLSRTADR